MTFYLNCPLQAEADYEEVLRQIYKTKWMKHFNKEKLRMLVRWTRILLLNTTVKHAVFCSYFLQCAVRLQSPDLHSNLSQRLATQAFS